jgi:hypothetical protein
MNTRIEQRTGFKVGLNLRRVRFSVSAGGLVSLFAEHEQCHSIPIVSSFSPLDK